MSITTTTQRGDFAAYAVPASARAKLAPTTLAEVLQFIAAGAPLPDAVRPAPLPTIRAATAREGLEAIIRGPGAVTFR